MSKLLGVSIDLSKIDKGRILEKNGAKYYNMTIELKDEANQWGKDVSIWESQTKEEREAKSNRKYIGDGKTVYTSPQQQAKGSDLPF